MTTCPANPDASVTTTLIVTDDLDVWSHRNMLAARGVTTVGVGVDDGPGTCGTIASPRMHDVACVLVDPARWPDLREAIDGVASHVLVHSENAWRNAANVEALRPRADGRTARAGLCDLLRLVGACSRPGFVCVDHADLVVFLDAMQQRPCRLSTAHCVVDERHPASDIDEWLDRITRDIHVIDIALVVDIPATFAALPALHWHLYLRAGAVVAGAAPRLLPIVPFHPRMRASGLRVTAFMLVAAPPSTQGESA